MRFAEAVKATTTGKICSGSTVFDLTSGRFAHDRGAMSLFDLIERGVDWEPYQVLPQIDGTWGSALAAMRDGWCVRRRSWGVAKDLKIISGCFAWRCADLSSMTLMLEDLEATDWVVSTPVADDERMPRGQTERT